VGVANRRLLKFYRFEYKTCFLKQIANRRLSLNHKNKSLALNIYINLIIIRKFDRIKDYWARRAQSEAEVDTGAATPDINKSNTKIFLYNKN